MSIDVAVDPINAELRMEYRFDGALPPRMRVAFPNRWAGRDGFFADIVSIRAQGRGGEPLPLTIGDDRVASITVDDHDLVVLSYVVRPQRSLLTFSTRYRALYSADRMFSPGHALFAEPLDLGAAFEEGIVVTSQEPAGVRGPDWRLNATLDLHEPRGLDELIDAAFFAGGFRHVRRERDGRIVDLWVEARVSAGPQALGDVVLDVVEAQTGVLGEAIAAQTTVVVLLREDDANALNGAGRTGGFVLEIGANVDVAAAGVAELIAHENFHRLNGHLLRFSAADEFATMWFREGVTDYVSMRNAAQHGVVETQSFFRFIGLALANYLSSPASGVAADGMSDGFWQDRDLRRLPYDKGALLALLIDLRLRAEERGDIESFFGFLRSDPSVRVLPLSNAVLRDALERYSGLDWVDFWQRHVLGAERLPVFERLNAVGLEVVERVEPAAYYGFRSSVSVDGQWFVARVEPGSPAEAAGLRSGMELSGEPYMPRSPNGGTAIVELTGGRGVATLHVESGRGQRRTFALSASDQAYLSAFGLGPPNDTPAR